jgi:hypothetical protein
MILGLPNHSERQPLIEASHRVDFENLQFYPAKT